MIIVQQVLFAVVFGLTIFLVYGRIDIIRKTILLGKPENRTDQPLKRWSTMLRIALGQKKMFDKPFVGILHLSVYAGFLLINIEVGEIVLDGLLGTHRLFAGFLGGFYTFLISFFELLAFSVLVACFIFLIRRKTGSVNRLRTDRHAEMNGWPEKDGTIILILEIALMTAILTMNAADLALQKIDNTHYTPTGSFLVSQFIAPAFSGWSETALVIYERFAWWIHIIGIFAFALYITYSKHLHIVLAFPNTYFSRLTPKGEMINMPEITREVKSMLGLSVEAVETEPVMPDRFGARDVPDLSWKNLMDAYSCTECGRCTDVCPANMTGKKLSPRKIMMDTRDRLEDIGKHMKTKNGVYAADEKFLMGDYISEEEILACTSCNACVQACPILINPLDIIFQLRRYKIMDEAQAPASWYGMLQNLETNQAPWKFSQADRFNWAENLRSS